MLKAVPVGRIFGKLRNGKERIGIIDRIKSNEPYCKLKREVQYLAESIWVDSQNASYKQTFTGRIH